MINGGFGLVLDGTEDAEQKARRVLSWDVANGVSDRQHPQGSPLCRLQTLLLPERSAALLPLRCLPQPLPGWPSTADSRRFTRAVSCPACVRGAWAVRPSRHCVFVHPRAQLRTLVCVLTLYVVRGPIPEGPHIRARKGKHDRWGSR